MTKLHDKVDYNNLYFKYVIRGKDVSFYNYKDSRKLFNAIKNTQIKLSDAKNSQDELLSKLNNIRTGRKTLEQEKIIDNLERFYISREEVINFFRDLTEMLSDANYKAKQNETKGIGLKYLHPSKCFKDCL